MKHGVWCLLLLLSLCLSSCDMPKERSMKKLSSYTEELETRDDDYVVENWDGLVERYKKIDSQLSEYEFSNEELREIGAEKVRCLTVLAKAAARSGSGKLNLFLQQMHGAVSGLAEEVDPSQIEESLENFIENLDIEDAKEMVEDYTEELKEAGKKLGGFLDGLFSGDD